jgi:hypothetical protein
MVRNTSVFVVGFFMIISASAQSLHNEIPTCVKQAFEQRFRNADHVLWKRLESRCFVVEFQIRKIIYAATFQETGTWLEMDTRVKRNYLPKSVRAAILRQFPGYEVEFAEKVDLIDYDTFYQAHLKNESTVKVVQFSSAGQVVQIPPKI